MTRRHWSGLLAAGIVLGALLVSAPLAHAGSAVDQYSEGIPTAKGQKPTRDAARGGGGGGGTPTIPPATQAELGQTEKGRAAEKAAKLTAPDRASTGGGGESTTDEGGLGLLLPLILGATLLTALAIFFGRRRAGAAPG